jgi:hypothetical protein
MPVAAVAVAGLAIGGTGELGTTLAVVAAVGAIGLLTGSKPLQIAGQAPAPQREGRAGVSGSPAHVLEA